MNPALWVPQLEAAGRSLLSASLAGAVLVALVLAAQFVLGRRLSPRWRYALWLLVVARLLLPVTPPSRASVFNLSNDCLPVAKQAGKSGLQKLSTVGTVGSLPHPGSAAAQIDAKPVSSQDRSPARASAWRGALACVWLAVACALLVRLALGNRRLSARVTRRRAVTRQDILDVLEDAKQELGVHVPVGVVETDRVASPALLGFVRPRLLLPPGVLDTFDRDELRLVFLHELGHVKRRDIAATWLMSVLCALHWFNPMVWIAYHRLRAEREMACDALVLSLGPTGDNERYGHAMIKVLESAAAPALVPGVAGILEDKGQLRRRMTMIANYSRTAYRGSALAVAVMAVLGLVTFTRAVDQPGAGGEAAALAEVTKYLNLDFELGPAPGGTTAAAWGGGGAGYELAVDEIVKHGGRYAGRIRNQAPSAEGFGTYTSFLNPETVAGRRVRYSGYLKLEGVTGSAGLWMRADKGGQPVAFDNMMQQQIRGTRDWQRYSIELDIPEGTDNINFGALISGGGTVWVDDLRIETVGGDNAGKASLRTAQATADYDYAPALAAIEEWLALADGGSSDGTYDTAATFFQNAVTRQDWARSFRAARPALGQVVSRTVSTRQHTTALPGAPDGDYVVVVFRAEFEHKKSAVETCSAMKDRDGHWRVAGYFIR